MIVVLLSRAPADTRVRTGHAMNAQPSRRNGLVIPRGGLTPGRKKITLNSPLLKSYTLSSPSPTLAETPRQKQGHQPILQKNYSWVHPPSSRNEPDIPRLDDTGYTPMRIARHYSRIYDTTPSKVLVSDDAVDDSPAFETNNSADPVETSEKLLKDRTAFVDELERELFRLERNVQEAMDDGAGASIPSVKPFLVFANRAEKEILAMDRVLMHGDEGLRLKRKALVTRLNGMLLRGDEAISQIHSVNASATETSEEPPDDTTSFYGIKQTNVSFRHNGSGNRDASFVPKNSTQHKKTKTVAAKKDFVRCPSRKPKFRTPSCVLKAQQTQAQAQADKTRRKRADEVSRTTGKNRAQRRKLRHDKEMRLNGNVEQSPERDVEDPEDWDFDAWFDKHVEPDDNIDEWIRNYQESWFRFQTIMAAHRAAIKPTVL